MFSNMVLHEALRAVLAVLVLISGLTCAVTAGTTGWVTGTVSDSSGKGLTGVNVKLEPGNLTTVTGDNGRFTFSNVVPGSYTITAELIGYAPATIKNIRVVMDIATRADIALEPTVEAEPEIVVIEDRILTSPQSTQNLYTLDAADQITTKAEPTSFYQAPSVVSSVPGVVQDSTGYIHIRGGNNDQVGWMVEGIPITTPLDNTFGTNLTTVGMSKLQVYTGGYQAEYGNAISGVLNEIKRTGSEIRGASAELTLGSESHRGAYIEAGNDKPGGLDWYLANYTWASDFRNYIANHGRASDTVLKAIYPASQKDSLTLLVLEGASKYRLPAMSPEPYPNQNDTAQAHHLVGLTWKRQLSGGMDFLLRPYFFESRNSVRGQSVEILGYQTDDVSVQKGLQAELRGGKGKHQLAAGIWYIDSSNGQTLDYPVLTGDPSLDPLQYTTNVGGAQIAVFAQDKISISPNLTLDAGIRYDSMRYSKQTTSNKTEDQLSPRVGLAYSKDPKTVFRISAGRFIQFVPTTAFDRIYTNSAWLGIFTPNEDLKPERATSYEASFEKQFGRDTIARITPFYREYKDLITRISVPPTPPGMPPFILQNANKARARGIEFYLARNMGHSTRGWISYTISKTDQQSLEDAGAWSAVDWDQRHTLETTLAHKMGSWESSLRLQYRSGQPWTDYSDQAVNTRRLPGNIIASASLSGDLGTGGKWGKLTVAIYNIFNSIVDTSRDGFGSAYSKTQPRFISIGYSRNFD